MILGEDRYYQCTSCGQILKKGSLLTGNNRGARYYSDSVTHAKGIKRFPLITKCQECENFVWLEDEIKHHKIPEINQDRKLMKEWRRNLFSAKGSMKERAEKPYSDKINEVYFLTLDETIMALEQKTFSELWQEKYLRNFIWKSFNDRVRSGKNSLFNNNQEQKVYLDNIQHLIHISLNEIEGINIKIKQHLGKIQNIEENERIKKISRNAINELNEEHLEMMFKLMELYRNQSNFEKSHQILNKITIFLRENIKESKYYEYKLEEFRKHIVENNPFVFLIPPIPKPNPPKEPQYISLKAPPSKDIRRDENT